MLGEFYGWLAFLAILVVLFVGIALFLFPKGKRAKDLDRSLTEAVEEWRSKGKEGAPAEEDEKAKAPNP